MLAALAGIGLLASSALSQGQAQREGEPQFKQVRLTEKHIKGYISAQKQLTPLASKLEGSGDSPDPALQKQVEQIAKSNGFSTLDEFAEVGANISMVLAGLDPKTGQFTEPPDLIRKEMEEVKQDKQMSQRDKDQALTAMQQALKAATPTQFKENVTLVKKYQKELDQVLGEESDQQQEPAKKQ
jgi:hypothetical protein